jgi:hypothetical protein
LFKRARLSTRLIIDHVTADAQRDKVSMSSLQYV